MSFTKLRIIYKVLILVASMAVITVAVAVMGKIGLGELAENIEAVEQAEKAALAGEAAAGLVLKMEVAELALAAQPTAEQISATEQVVQKLAGEIEQTLGAFRRSADAEHVRLLDPVETAFRQYHAGIAQTVERARRLGGQVTLG